MEASATCGFAYGILKGVSLGLGEAWWARKALKAVEPILGFTDEDGVVHQVSYGTPMGRESKDFYKEIELKPMPYGQALAMLFFMESRNYVAECLWQPAAVQARTEGLRQMETGERQRAPSQGRLCRL